MNYQQSYPGVWLGPVTPHRPVKVDVDPDGLLADLEKERQRELESIQDEARERLDGRYDD